LPPSQTAVELADMCETAIEITPSYQYKMSRREILRHTTFRV